MATDLLMTELEYGDKIYTHNQFETYTWDGESIILVDTTVARTVRLTQVPNFKRSVVIKDITGNANTNPILITIAPSTLISTPVVLQAQTERQFQMYVPWGAAEFTAYQNQWVLDTPRCTCISNRGFRLPQNLNLALPPAYGAIRQHFPGMTFFPAIMKGVDNVPSNYNGLVASVAYEEQVTKTDDSASLTSLFAQPNPPVIDPASFTANTITADTTWNVPNDFQTLAQAQGYLGTKDILPGVIVTVTVDGDNINGLVNFNHPQASQIVFQGQTPLTLNPVSTSVSQSVPGAVFVDIALGVTDMANVPVGSYIVIDKVVAYPAGSNTPIGDLRRWIGAWPVIAQLTYLNGQAARIQITDWGTNFPTAPMVPTQARWRVLPTVVNMTGGANLYFGSDGYTFNDIAFIGAANAQTALTLRGVLNLNTVVISGFKANGIYSSYRSILNTADVYSCGNTTGLYLERQAVLVGDTSPSNTILCLSGNSSNGLSGFSSADGVVNPLFCTGNNVNGITFTNLSNLEVYNSYILANGVGINSTTGSLVSGNTNTISESTGNDLQVSDSATVRMTSTSAFNLGTPNGQLNSDGSRIELSTV